MKDHKAMLAKIKAKGEKQPEKETPKNSDNKPIVNPTKKDVFNAYAMWYSIPLMVKNLSPQARESYGLKNDELIDKLIQIRTKTQFAKEFKVDMNTLKDWERSMSWKEVDTNMKKWMKSLTSRVRMSLFTTAVKTGKAPEVKLFEQLINDFSEKTTTERREDIYIVDDGKAEELKTLLKNARRKRR